MIGILLIVTASLFEEFSTSSAKESITRKIESIPSRVVLVGVWSIFFFGASLLAGAEWRFSAASLPFFIPRLLLEILLAHITVSALARADRSTFGFIRTLTIPLVLGIELALGTALLPSQIAGVTALFFALAVLGMNHALDGKGMRLALLSACISAITLSLFKYDITHYNSVAAEQLLATVIVWLYFLGYAIVKLRENPFRLLRTRRILSESAASGVANLIGSFAYSFAPAAVIVATQRATGVAFSIVAGALRFHERHIGEKFLVLGLTVLGIVLLVR